MKSDLSERVRPLRILPDALDWLREHPHFTLQDDPYDAAVAGDVLPIQAIAEADRGTTYRSELLRMFRQRTRLVALLGLVLLPLFSLFYIFLSPPFVRTAVAQPVLLTHGLMMVACLVVYVLVPHMKNLAWARLLPLVGYTIICLGAAVVTTLMMHHQLSGDSTPVEPVEFIAMAAHSQIMLSILLMPFAVWESLIVILIVAISVVWSQWLPLWPYDRPLYVSHVFVLSTTAFFVLCITHFQSVLRRRAFNAAFDLARTAAQLQMLSTLDPVTGGFNRHYLDKMLGIELARADRYEHPLSVLMFDLDNFKPVNDTLGHAVGDEVLCTVCEAAGSALRQADTVARYGGDEFIAVLPEADAEAALDIAERLQVAVRTQLCERFGTDSLQAEVALSIGIVTLHPTDSLSLDEVIEEVDKRLYEAKRRGKNCIVA